MTSPSTATFRIGELARLTGASVPTIRFYEQQGLLATITRQANGQRVYGSQDVSTVQFIRRARSFDFPLPAVRRLLDLRGDVNCSCDGLLDFGKLQLEALRERLASLKVLEQELAGIISSCESTCFGGPVGDCTIKIHLDSPNRATKTSVTGPRRPL